MKKKNLIDLILHTSNSTASGLNVVEVLEFLRMEARLFFLPSSILFDSFIGNLEVFKLLVSTLDCQYGLST